MSMNKRHFVAAGMGLAGLWTAAGSSHAAPKAKSVAGPALLTISGAIAKTNRGALDPAIDQMMGKHGIQFANAYALDAAALQRMPAVTIQPTLEYDSKPHTLKGPLLTTVLAAAGVAEGSPVQLVLRAVHRPPRPIERALAPSLGAGAATGTLFRRRVALDPCDADVRAAGVRCHGEVRDVDVDAGDAIHRRHRRCRPACGGAGGDVRLGQHHEVRLVAPASVGVRIAPADQAALKPAIALTSRYSSRPNLPHSRPLPDCL